MFYRVRRSRTRATMFHVMSNDRLTFNFKRIRKATINFHVSNGRMSSRNCRYESVSLRSRPTIDLSFCCFKRLRNSRRRCRYRCTRSTKRLMTSGLHATSRNSGRQRFVIKAPTYRRSARCTSAQYDRRRRRSCVRIRCLRSLISKRTNGYRREDSSCRRQYRVMRRPIERFRVGSFLYRRLSSITKRLRRSPFPRTRQARTTLRRNTCLALRMGRSSNGRNVRRGSTCTGRRTFRRCYRAFQRRKDRRLICPINCCAGIGRIIRLLFAVCCLRFAEHFLVCGSRYAVCGLTTLWFHVMGYGLSGHGSFCLSVSNAAWSGIPPVTVESTVLTPQRVMFAISAGNGPMLQGYEQWNVLSP